MSELTEGIDVLAEQREDIASLKESVEYYADMMYHYME